MDVLVPSLRPITRTGMRLSPTLGEKQTCTITSTGSGHFAQYVCLMRRQTYLHLCYPIDFENPKQAGACVSQLV